VKTRENSREKFSGKINQDNSREENSNESHENEEDNEDI
jgi:hypothetical protein